MLFVDVDAPSLNVYDSGDDDDRAMPVGAVVIEVRCQLLGWGPWRVMRRPGKIQHGPSCPSVEGSVWSAVGPTYGR